MTYNTNKLYKEYKERFGIMSDDELVNAFNSEVGNAGWTSARSAYLAALHEEFELRGYDFSKIGNKEELSFRHKIKIVNKKVIVVDEEQTDKE